MSNEMKDWLAERRYQQTKSKAKGMCMFCDNDSEWCRIWIDALTNDWYLEIETGHYGQVDKEWETVREFIEYCPYCGRRLSDERREKN